jgi:transposase
VRADELLDERTLSYDEWEVERLLRRWPAVRCCYEAGPTGFGLYRHLVERGIDCQVVAPGLVPQRPGDRVKTDSRDARKLARLLAGGLLEPIHVPSSELEAARDLVRAREDARLDRMRDRQRLSKFCLRHGRLLPTSSWTILRRKWLGEQRFGYAAEQLTFDTYLHTVDLVDARIEQLEQAIRSTAEEGPWRELVARLRCLRGIDTLTALALVAEIGDFHRFKTAEELMAFVGLVPSEHSSGEKRRQGSITKVGNAHVRRLLVEAAWHARRRPKVGYELARRQRGHDATVIERSWRCQQRLFQRWQRMAGRGKPQQKIVVACARELAGFVWAIATEQPLRNT